jgi:tetratricopeptide (TPR) repeat protein
MMYDAFISYSHAKDTPLGEAVQALLQRLGKVWYNRTSLKIFRDATGLRPTPALWPSIVSALGQARFLIYLASPEAAASAWVRREVEWWLHKKGVKSLIIVLVDGNLVWNHKDRSLESDGPSALPPALQLAFQDAPLWIDLRKYRSSAPNVIKNENEFISLVAGISAKIRGIPKEDVFSDELKQQRKALTVAWSAVGLLAMLTILVAFAAGIAMHQRNRSETLLTKTARTANGLVFDLSERFRTQLGTPDNLVLGILDQAKVLTEGLMESGEFRQELAVSRAMAIAGVSEIYTIREEYSQAISQANDAITALRNVEDKFTINDDMSQKFKYLMGIAFERSGDAFLGAGRVEEAETAYKTSLDYYNKIGLPNQSERSLTRDKSVELEKLGRIVLDKGELNRASDLFRQVHDLREGLVIRWNNDSASSDEDKEEAKRDLAVSFGNIGRVFSRLGTVDNLSAYLSSVLLSRELVAARPDHAGYQSDLARSLRELGESYVVKRQLKEAESAFDVSSRSQ